MSKLEKSVSKEKIIKVILKKDYKKADLSAEVYELSRSVGLISEKKFFSTTKKLLAKREKEFNVLKNDIALLSALAKQEVYASYIGVNTDK